MLKYQYLKGSLLTYSLLMLCDMSGYKVQEVLGSGVLIVDL